MKLVVTVFCIITLSSACSLIDRNRPNNEGKLLAQVGNNYLYLEEIEDIINPGDDEDTSDIIYNYINSWVRKQLVLQVAEEQLPDEINDIEKKVQDYKESLIIYRYEQELIEQKLDTSISGQEIKDYYEQYKSNFILEFDIIDINYVKLLTSSPTKDSVYKWFLSETIESSLKLEEFCNQYAIMYNIGEHNWVETNRVEILLNMGRDEISSSDFNKSNFIVNNENHQLMVKVKGRRLKGSEAPLEYVEDDIKKILINKNKIKLIDDTHKAIMEKGIQQNKFKIYFDS